MICIRSPDMFSPASRCGALSDCPAVHGKECELAGRNDRQYPSHPFRQCPGPRRRGPVEKRHAESLSDSGRGVYNSWNPVIQRPCETEGA